MTRAELLDALATAERRVAVTRRVIAAAGNAGLPVDLLMLPRAMVQVDAARAALAWFDRAW